MPLSFTVLSPVFAFYNFYKECSTMSPPRSFWSLILCFNLLLSIFITIVRNLVSSLWSFHRHCTLQFLFSYSQPTHSSSNTIQNVFLTTCFLIVLAYFHLQSIEILQKYFLNYWNSSFQPWNLKKTSNTANFVMSHSIFWTGQWCYCIQKSSNIVF